jgi:hypothetical protein
MAKRINNDLYSWTNAHLVFKQQPICLQHFSSVPERRRANTSFIVYGLTQAGLEPTIFHLRGEHTNHYTTD